MNIPPIPQRLPTLAWRAPVAVTIPFGLAIAIGWPLALFLDAPQSGRLALVCAGLTMTLGLSSIWLRWLIRGAPMARRVIVRHIVVSGALVSVAAPALLGALFGGARDLGASIALAPLMLLVGLPIALVSGIAFALIALIHPRRIEEADFPRADPQPFQ
jgi:hypothetical protein